MLVRVPGCSSPSTRRWNSTTFALTGSASASSRASTDWPDTHRFQRIEMVLAEDAPPVFQQLEIERFGLGMLALRHVQASEHAHGGQGVGMLFTERPAGSLQ